MSREGILQTSLRMMVIIAATLALTLSWSSVAAAQQGGPPADEQYGNPASSIGPSESGSGDTGSEGAGSGDVASASVAQSGEPGAAAGSASQAVSVLPDTGGPALLLSLAGLAMLGAGMLLIRQVGRR
ncbi:LPXTG cell wall anchor domain-containing protein [Rubrobacter aplysinae]|uniref:LPXTG cell wall anchor domain-containing protein n=1 Tax=Rubrobacter aplysinae TaxID=909625 RepID=UPI00064C2A71|nr:LPXTG cell wall anchor domain-containing protein [Rubrobacter aplysinae]